VLAADPGGPGLVGLGSESAIDVKPEAAARRFAELQRRAPIRALRARKRGTNTFDITQAQPWRLTRRAGACSARSLQPPQTRT
jgi:hypothetical protein